MEYGECVVTKSYFELFNLKKDARQKKNKKSTTTTAM
jgi:hypothetical protein